MPALLTACPALLALELKPEGAPTAFTLSMESAALLADAIANDLARLLPGVETMGLAVAAGLYDQAQILRPGWPVHGELMLMYQQAQRGDFLATIMSFGSAAGRMASELLEPDPQLVGSPLLLVPFVLVGHAMDAAQIGAQMERDFEEKGLAAAATAMLLQEAFSVQVEHARYLTHHDLCALAAMQYEHAGLEPIWRIVECALLAPQQSEQAELEDGVRLEYRDRQVLIAGDAQTLAYRQACAILGAHGLSAQRI